MKTITGTITLLAARNNDKPELVVGHRVRLDHDWGDFVLYQGDRWHVVEFSTGCGIGWGVSPEDAIVAAEERLKKKGRAVFMDRLFKTEKINV